MRLRSVELETPQADVGVRFLTSIWGLRDAGRRGNTNYLRATEAFPYVLALTPGDRHLITSVTLEGSAEEIGMVRERAQAKGCPVTATRDFVKQCTNPVLILPDDIPAHPYAVAMEAAMLAPKAEVSMFPWKEPKERIPLAVRQIRSFLKAHKSV